MAELDRVLIQLDPGEHASTFDSIVAIDAGADRLLRFKEVEPAAVEPLVHGAIFTRGVDALKHTAIFVGGADVEHGEALFEQVTKSFFGPFRVSAMLDPNGANTTAVAAVQLAGQHLHLEAITAVVLAGTGPVGQRVVRLLSRAGAQVRLASRRLERAEAACRRIAAQLEDAPNARPPIPVQVGNPDETAVVLENCDLVVSAAAGGIELVAEATWQAAPNLQLLIDLNAVPPAGIAGVEVTDKGTERHGKLTYGALGVGGLKMKIHKKCVARLFEGNDWVLDAEQIMAIASEETTA
ncbi:MAG: NADP-dependent methylenetetrahydromethanopterin/methylenetetrahydrofolate dehydrogenase [Planctomycetota bacterium]